MTYWKPKIYKLTRCFGVVGWVGSCVVCHGLLAMRHASLVEAHKSYYTLWIVSYSTGM